jgi:hypothetical protein
VSGPVPSPPSGLVPDRPPPEAGAGPPPTNEGGESRSTGGRSRRFREQEAERKSNRRQNVGVILVVVILVLGIYTIATARPYSASSHHTYPTPGPPISVQLGTPSVSTVPCAGGGTAYAEHIPWENASQTVTTGDVAVHVYEIFDGDYILDPGAVANATSSNVCAGAPPSSTSIWYAVLAAPNGTNLLGYTVANGWASVSGGPWNFDIENGSALVLVTHSSLANTGRGLAVTGFANGSPISGTVVL